MDSYRRSRSQSRFPPPDDFNRDFNLDPSHRSKSLDNRRDFNRDGDYWYDPPTGGGFGRPPPDGNFGRPSADGGFGRPPADRGFGRPPADVRVHQQSFPSGKPPHFDRSEEFYNESVNIPIQKEGESGGASAAAVQRSHALAAQYAAEGLENENYTFDRKVHVENDRKVNIYPSRRRYHEEHYRSGGGGYAAGGGYAQGISPRSAGTRYGDSEYNYRQHQVQQRPLEYTRSAESHREAREHFDDATTLGPPERTGTLGTRSGIGGARGGHRSYEYHREYHGGGSGAARHAGAATNGYGYKHEYGARSGWGSYGGAGFRKERVHHKVHCCCFSFYWPPWGYETVEPPRPMYPSKHAPPPPGPGPY